MKYRLLALDMDGTLLDPNKLITTEAHEAIREFRKQGGLVTIASGRFPASVWLHAQAVGMNAPLIALNGAVILDEVSGELRAGTALLAESVQRLVRLVEERGAYIHLYGYNVLYVKECNEMNARWPLANVVVASGKELTETNYQDQLGYIQVKPVGNLDSFLSAAQVPLYKATVISDHPELIEKLMELLAGWNAFTLTRTGKYRVDVNASGVSKRSALEYLCFEDQISQAEVAAIGDYDNDIDMLQWAGLGIAMGNAEEHVKQIADTVTSSNQDNGVAQAVMNYLIKNQFE